MLAGTMLLISHPTFGLFRAVLGLGLLAVVGCTSAEKGEPCELDDADGVIGGNYEFELTVSDTEFTPKIIKTQNSAMVRLTLTNEGTTTHDFKIDCLPTPNSDGCPQEACFADEAEISAVAPGQKGNATFMVPRAEGIYTFRSTQNGDEQTGQFVVN